ncbi:nucleoside triphosphate pyrophosphohydrolase family protein [Agarilytica rhodophyticola]|uniref:nucleoside triphosphate pyrophosphohydrolase family protein n=1 Tax=Agarilytica rhodophyticola TaxID=1737490 RepID=UPI000B3461A7|nr:nucleoside triphosphate pyrophosphohydrolase family protein [Agarilytica rhodophyticola]
MEVDEYQALAAETMQFDKKESTALSIVMLGLNGEVGGLSTEYKKKLRDGDNYEIFKEKLIEELGDIIWYLASIATIEDIPLSQILTHNLKKTQDRWEDLTDKAQLELEGEFFDDNYDEDEQLPREFVAEFREGTDKHNKKCVNIFVNGETFGNTIRDNHYEGDYYRYHDLFHFSYVTVLGWSPTSRGLMHKKRRSDEKVNEIEDGGRAVVIDEAISALVFEHARNHNFYEGVTTIDEQLLQTIRLLTRHLEVSKATPKQWEQAILTGFEVWRKMRVEKTGRVICNLHEKTMLFEPLDNEEHS